MGCGCYNIDIKMLCIFVIFIFLIIIVVFIFVYNFVLIKSMLCVDEVRNIMVSYYWIVFLMSSDFLMYVYFMWIYVIIGKWIFCFFIILFGGCFFYFL